MKKNIGKLKQWTNEKLGSSQKTQTSEEFQELEQLTDHRHNYFDKLIVASNAYLKQISKKKEGIEEKGKVSPLECLGTVMRVFGEQIGSDSPFGLALVRFGTGNEKVASAQLEYVSRVRDEFLGRLEENTQELREYQQLKRKLQSRRLDYDAKLNRLQKSKKEKPGLEEELQAAKQKYEETVDEMWDKMQSIQESEDQNVQEVTTFLEAQLEFFKKGHEILQAVRDDWIEDIPKRTFSSRPMLNRSSTRGSANSRSDVEDQGSDDASMHSSGTRSRDIRSISRTPTHKSRSEGGPSSRAASRGIVRQSSRSSPPSRRATSSPSRRKRVRALYDFDGDGEDELRIEVDDVITVVEEIDEGWWTGEITDEDGRRREGMFPANYTEEITDDEQRPAPPKRRPTSTVRRNDRDDDEYASADRYEDDYDDDYDDSRNYEKPKHSMPTRSSVGSRPVSTRSPSSSQRSSVSQAKRSVPPVPSRATKPPAQAGMQMPIPRVQPAMRQPSIGARSPPVPASRASYIPQDFGRASASVDVGPCSECGCNEFSPDLFKKDKCNNCFHKH